MEYIGFVHYMMIIILTSGTDLANSNDLKFVHLLIRHGDRTPTHLFPNDTNLLYTWPQGLAQLTKLGVSQGYNLGKFLRQEYVNDSRFLNPQYKGEELYVRSTDRSRTLMFGSALLQGLYPEHESALWDPIPVHTQPRMTDPTLFMDIPCERYDKQFMSLINSANGKALQEQNKELMKYVCQEAGYTNVSIWNTWELYDPLSIEIQNNRSIPEWATPKVYEQIHQLYLKKFEYFYSTPDLRKIRGGLFVTELYNHTKQTIRGGIDSADKMNIYIAHETTIAATLSALGIWDKTIPPIASVVFFELYRMQNGAHTIRILYKNNTVTDPFGKPYAVILPGCAEYCPVETFYKLAEPVLFENENAWFVYCKRYPGSNITKGGIIAVSIFSCLFLIGLIVLFAWCYKHHQQEVHYRPANFSSESA